MVSTMADQIYGIHQSQPRDVYNYLKANAGKLGLVGRFSYLPNLRSRAQAAPVGLSSGLELIVSDKVSYYDEPTMDGRIRRYSKAEIYLVLSGAAPYSSVADIKNEITELGYVDIVPGPTYSIATAYAYELGIPAHAVNPSHFASAEKAYIRAGVATYVNDFRTIMDAPSDGESYVRLNGEWVIDDHVLHATIDGGTATLS